MTGIAAIFSSGPASSEQLNKMMGAMAGRARDGVGRLIEGRVALGACILHTTAEALEADLPYRSEDRSIALVLDGFLTNYDELRRDLIERGFALRNRSEAELVLRAYEQWGDDCAARIEGEYALVIFDGRKRELYCARDHNGSRPLFYYQTLDALLVASDIASIIHALDHLPQPNMDFLAGVAAADFWLPEDTAWVGLQRLRKAHWLRYCNGQIGKHQYWSVPTEVTVRYGTTAEYAEHYRAILVDAIRRCSRTHRPLGMAVSGGLDSSSLFCLAHRLQSDGQLLAPSIRGYTLAANPQSPAFELPFARAVASHTGEDITEVTLFKPSLDWLIQRSRRDCDIPVATNGAMTVDIEQRAAADGCAVYINGDGGDEWLQGHAGYFREAVLDFDIRRFVHLLRRDAGITGWRPALRHALRTGLSPAIPAGLREWRRAKRRAKRYSDNGGLFWIRSEYRAKLQHQEARYSASLPEEVGAWLKVNLAGSPFSEFADMTMQRQRGMNGIEGRTPMLTRQFIEFSATTPEYTKSQPDLFKLLHRGAMRGILPEKVRNRTSKADFESYALDAQMGHFAIHEGYDFLESICERDGIRRLIALEGRDNLDDDRSWEIWGVYAVAAFLSYCRDEFRTNA